MFPTTIVIIVLDFYIEHLYIRYARPSTLIIFVAVVTTINIYIRCINVVFVDKLLCISLDFISRIVFIYIPF